jgi:hypothetical protein
MLSNTCKTFEGDNNDNDDHKLPPSRPSRNCAATYFARQASFAVGSGFFDTTNKTFDRKRSCISVTSGLGTWTCVSISNWSSKSAIVSIPNLALRPPPLFRTGLYDSSRNNKAKANGSLGYHVFAFWSGEYSWISCSNIDDNTVGSSCINKRLASHETEVYHIKEVSANIPQYIGSTIHFSCGYEVRRFRATSSSVWIQLKTDYQRQGNVFVYIPTILMTTAGEVTVQVNNERAQYSVIANTPTASATNAVGQILQIPVIIYADTTLPHDGEIRIEF